MFKQIKFFILIFSIISFVYGIQTDSKNSAVYVKSISFKGAIDKNELKDLEKISEHYIDKKLSLKEIGKLKKDLSSYFKNRGLLFTKVILPSQDMSKGVLKFFIMKTKVGDIYVKGNRYYSTKFIKRVFGFKKGENLQYRKMLKTILLINSYEDISAKSYLKKGSKFGTTDVTLDINDTKPLHLTFTIDNLGSEDTSKNRVGTDVDYGNLLSDGDQVTLKLTIGLDSIKSNTTKFLSLNYTTPPMKNFFTKVNFGYMYADYVTSGDLSALDMQGDTKIYTIGLKQPLYYSTTIKSNLYLNYYKKHIISYLMGALSTRDRLNLTELKVDLRYAGLRDIFACSISASRGIGADNSMQSRVNSDSRFMKYALSSSYIRYINPKNSLNISLNSQYSADRLPLSELYTIGGFTSVRGFKSAQKLGDSGFNINLEWFYHPELGYFKWLKNSAQIGFFLDYGEIFNNNPVPGEEKSSSLSAVGTEIIVDINKRYFGRISIGFPVDASDDSVEKSAMIYGYVGMKLR